MNEREKILEKTNNGYNIFSYYLGDRVGKKVFCNPFRSDTAPSCRLRERERNGSRIWTMVDYGDSDWCGDVFTIIAKSMRLNPVTDFHELLKTIDKDMNLYVMDEVPAGHHSATYAPPPVNLGGSPVSFSPTYQTFRSWEIKYWNRFGITEETLSRYHVRSIHSCRFYRADKTSYAYQGSYMEPMYGYLFNDGSGIKCYRPFSKTRFLYAGKLPNPYVFGWEQLPSSGEYVIITGGEKDVMTLATHGFSAVAFNSESAHIGAVHLDELSRRFKCILFMYDTDETGRREAQRRVDELSGTYHVGQILLPLCGTKREKDVSDFFSLGHHASELQELIDQQLKK